MRPLLSPLPAPPPPRAWSSSTGSASGWPPWAGACTRPITTCRCCRLFPQRRRIRTASPRPTGPLQVPPATPPLARSPLLELGRLLHGPAHQRPPHAVADRGTHAELERGRLGGDHGDPRPHCALCIVRVPVRRWIPFTVHGTGQGAWDYELRTRKIRASEPTSPLCCHAAARHPTGNRSPSLHLVLNTCVCTVLGPLLQLLQSPHACPFSAALPLPPAAPLYRKKNLRANQARKAYPPPLRRYLAHRPPSPPPPQQARPAPGLSGRAPSPQKKHRNQPTLTTNQAQCLLPHEPPSPHPMRARSPAPPPPHTHTLPSRC
jgi:hypothetical protein